jgi:selenocysteine lyase/cysteine desulfurase
VGLVSLNLKRFAPAELGAILDEQFDIAVRPGLHCAPYAHKHLGTFPLGTVRLSVGTLTTEDEMRRAAAALDEIAAG